MSAKRTAVSLQVIQGGAGSSDALDELTGAGQVRLVSLPLTDLHQHPDNPRRDLGDLTELAASIAAQGVQQPLMVVPDPDDAACYRIVIGHRRAAAAKVAGLLTVPALVRDLTPLEQRELMLVENLQRTDLTPVEEADAYQGLLDLGVDVAGIVASTGRSESTVRRRLHLVALPDQARTAVHTGSATLGDAAALAEFEDDPARLEKVAAALGTRDFAAELQKARRQVEQERVFRPLVDRLVAAGAALHDQYESPTGATLAASLSQHNAGGTGGSDHNYNTSLDVTERLIEQAGAGWFYGFWYGDLRVWRPYTEEELAAQAATAQQVKGADARWKAQQAEQIAARKAAADRNERFSALRLDFVKGLMPRKVTAAQQQLIVDAVAWVAVHGWVGLCLEDVNDVEGLALLLGVDEAAAHDDDRVIQTAIEALDAAHQVLLALALGHEDAINPSTYSTSQVQAYYTLLAAFGYTASTEELAAIYPPEAEVVVEGGED